MRRYNMDILRVLQWNVLFSMSVVSVVVYIRVELHIIKLKCFSHSQFDYPG